MKPWQTSSCTRATGEWRASTRCWACEFVRVDDTGRGIPPDRIASVFEPFQQVEPGDPKCGQGLGLSISRQFARSMNGDITLSAEVGVGSTFTLWVPTDASLLSGDVPIPVQV